VPADVTVGADGPREVTSVSDTRVLAGFFGWEDKR
jgi:hypothetical protein